MEGVDLPLLHALQLRPQTGAGQGVGEDLEEGEVLEAGVVPQLGEQAALLKQTQKRGLLRDKPPSLLSSQPAPSPGARLPPEAWEPSPALETRRSRSACSGCLREDGAPSLRALRTASSPWPLSEVFSQDPYLASFPRGPGEGRGWGGCGWGSRMRPRCKHSSPQTVKNI